MRYIDRIHTPIVLGIGTLETPSSSGSRATLRAALKKAGKPVKLSSASDYNHYEVGETVGHPYATCRPRAMKMMNLSTAAYGTGK